MDVLELQFIDISEESNWDNVMNLKPMLGSVVIAKLTNFVTLVDLPLRWSESPTIGSISPIPMIPVIDITSLRFSHPTTDFLGFRDPF